MTTVPAAQGAAQAAAAAAAAAVASPNSAPSHGQPFRGPHNQSGSGEGPLSSEQALSIVEKLVPALMAAAHHNGSAPSPVAPLGMRSINQQLPPRAPMPSYREAYGGYQNGAGQSSAYIHGNLAGPYGHPNRIDYGRNDYYYDTPPAPVAGYSPAFSYMGTMGNMGGPMSPAMGGMGGAGYGGLSASVLEDQLLGTYGGGIHRLQTSSLRQGGGGNGYGVGGYGAAAGGGGVGYLGGSVVGGGAYGSEYDADLAGFRSQSGGGQTSSFGGGVPSGGLYGGSGFGGQTMYGQGNDVGDRYTPAGRGGHFGMSGVGGMNGFGLNGFGPGGGANHGPGGGTSSSYDYGGDGSPPFQATDLLRQDSTGLYNLSNPTSSSGGGGSGVNASNAGAAATNKVGNNGKVNGHLPSSSNAHGAPGGGRPGGGGGGVGMGDVDGMHDLTSRFGGLAVGTVGNSLAKGPISPGPASGVSGTFASQQHFRAESGRYN